MNFRVGSLIDFVPSTLPQFPSLGFREGVTVSKSLKGRYYRYSLPVRTCPSAPPTRLWRREGSRNQDTLGQGRVGTGLVRPQRTRVTFTHEGRRHRRLPRPFPGRTQNGGNQVRYCPPPNGNRSVTFRCQTGSYC